MAALPTVGIAFLIGATLSVRFNVLILVLAIGLMVFGTALVGIAHGDSVRSVTLTIAFVAAALQLGYLFGLLTRAVIVSLSMQRQQLGGEFMTTARWPNLAERGWGQSEALDRATCLRDIQTIGQELRATYELQHDLPHRMLALLMQLNEQHGDHSAVAAETAS